MLVEDSEDYEDLDFADKTVEDPVFQNDKKDTSSQSIRSSPCLDRSEIPEVHLESDDGKGDDGGSEQGDRTPQSFKAGFWSDNEAETKTVDSWEFPVQPIPWDDNDRQIEKLLSYADLTLTEEEENGLLTDRIVAACSSHLTRTPGTNYHVVAKVSLNNKNINDIRILGYHRFLQYVDLSWNNLTDLTPLGCLPYLMYLDVSHNLMEEVLRFRPPLNLTYVNYSYNEVWQIDDLTDFWALSYLDLSHNKISKIQGLHNLRYLRHLDLSHNKIEKFENLKHLRITDLNLEYNLISKFEMEPGLGALPYLVNIYLNNNLIRSLKFLEGATTVKQLELQNNCISDLVELSHLRLLRNLRSLDLTGSPVSKLKPYRSVILNYLQELKFLDQTEVKLSEKAVSCKKKTFEVQLEAARNHARMVLLEQLNDPSLDLDVLPVDQGPYPFVILVGPPGSNKKAILALLKAKYEDKIYIGKIHTTREVLESEEHILIHLKREDFDENIKAGKFLCVSETLGQLYGFKRDELAESVRKQKLCVTEMDMVAALTVHNHGIQPFLVLAIPQSTNAHIERLKKMYGPVFAVLGGTYIAEKMERTLLSETKDMSFLMENVLDEVMQAVENCDNHWIATETLQSTRSHSTGKRDSVVPAPEPVCYMGPTDCYACTPSKCGYQTCMLEKENLSNSTPSKTDVSNSEVNTNAKFVLNSVHSTDSETSSQRPETSYSATLPPDMKMSISVHDGSSCGEDNPFDDWSMPFIDWSEVNLTSTDRDQAAELLCQKYIETVLASRDTYQNLHLENPGLFDLSVYTDNPTQAAKDIAKFLKEVWRSTPQRKPTFDVHNDIVYETYVPRKLEALKQILRNDFLSAEGDGKFVCATNNRPNSPLGICAEMRNKGYGDFVENF